MSYTGRFFAGLISNLKYSNLFLLIILAAALKLPANPLIAQSVADKDILFWSSGRQLQLKDFKVVSDSARHVASNVAALTRTGIIYYLTTDKIGNRPVSIRINIEATVHRSHTFVKKSVLKMPPDRLRLLLNHEQKHFDISEIYAREAMQELLNVKLTKNYKEEIRKLVQEKFKAAEAFQHLYDAETRNGEDFEAQQEWDNKIAGRLKELEQFKRKIVIRKL